MAARPSTPRASLHNKVALVTGSTSGLGRETAASLASMGATVIMAVRNTELGEKVASEIREQHPEAKVIVGPRLDLESQASIHQFVKEFSAAGHPLHLLINNAGANYVGLPWYTPEGIGGQAQVNYLGPYLLTRLLEERLLESAPSRVVNLSSVTHRFGTIGDPSTFLTNWSQGSKYQNSKLANAMFAFELHRRMAPFGVQSCAVDPGGVASAIWRDSVFSKTPLKFFIDALYAPVKDGAAAIVHAATVDWQEDAKLAAEVNRNWAVGKNGSSSGTNAATAAVAAEPKSKVSVAPSAPLKKPSAAPSDPNDLRFYARGLFAWPTMTSTRGIPGAGNFLIDSVRGGAYAINALVHSGLDWPVRRFSGGKIAATIAPVPTNPLCYDADLSKALWEVSAETVGVPHEVLVATSPSGIVKPAALKAQA